jgi:hypothetical protein
MQVSHEVAVKQVTQFKEHFSQKFEASLKKFAIQELQVLSFEDRQF